MISQISQPRLKGFRFPRSIISYAVWAYHRFALSLRDVEDLLVERGIVAGVAAYIGAVKGGRHRDEGRIFGSLACRK